MIFATVGSHPTYRFDRFLRALEALPGEDLVVQYGPGEPPANAARAERWMSFAEVLDHMDRAEKVVSHAGTGTILCATRAGHAPLVVPRLKRYGETVDDHQLELARALAGGDGIVLVEDVESLPAELERAPARGSSAVVEHGELQAAVRDELLGASR